MRKSRNFTGAHNLNTKHDPVISAGQGNNIFIWNSTKESNAIVQKIVGERREYGMKSGVTIPIRNKATSCRRPVVNTDIYF